MAQVTVRLNGTKKEFEVMCDGKDEEEVLDDIANRGRLDSEILDFVYSNLNVVEAEYDEEEEEEDEEDIDEELEDEEDEEVIEEETTKED